MRALLVLVFVATGALATTRASCAAAHQGFRRTTFRATTRSPCPRPARRRRRAAKAAASQQPPTGAAPAQFGMEHKAGGADEIDSIESTIAGRFRAGGPTRNSGCQWPGLAGRDGSQGTHWIENPKVRVRRGVLGAFYSRSRAATVRRGSSVSSRRPPVADSAKLDRIVGRRPARGGPAQPHLPRPGAQDLSVGLRPLRAHVHARERPRAHRPPPRPQPRQQPVRRQQLGTPLRLLPRQRAPAAAGSHRRRRGEPRGRHALALRGPEGDAREKEVT